MKVTVAAASEDVRFIGTVPAEIRQYSIVGISAAHEVNGENTGDALTWTFGGANPADYTAVVEEGGRSVLITCDSPSATPLIVTAAYGDYSTSVSIKLMGY